MKAFVFFLAVFAAASGPAFADFEKVERGPHARASSPAGSDFDFRMDLEAFKSKVFLAPSIQRMGYPVASILDCGGPVLLRYPKGGEAVNFTLSKQEDGSFRLAYRDGDRREAAKLVAELKRLVAIHSKDSQKGG